MKTWTKILLAVLSLVMVLGLVACGGDEPAETPAESTPVETPKATEPAPTETEPTETEPTETEPTETEPTETEPTETEPTETEPPVGGDEAPEFADAVKGFVTGEIVDGKIVLTNSANSTYPWAGTNLEGYAIVSGNAGIDSSFSAIKFPITVTEDAVLKFNVKVDTGADTGDYVYILVNGLRYGRDNLYNGEHAVVVDLAAGSHEVTIAYRKDDVANSGVTDAAYLSKITVEKAPYSITPVDLEMTLDMPAQFADAAKYEVETVAYKLNGSSTSTVGSCGVVYIKKSHDYPGTSFKFTVDADGTYEVLIAIGGKDRTSAGACATGLVQVDNGQKYYLNSPCQNADGTSEYFVGMTVELTAGEHDFHMYLAEDFNDASVKSIYFDYISFVKK